MCSSGRFIVSLEDQVAVLERTVKQGFADVIDALKQGSSPQVSLAKSKPKVEARKLNGEDKHEDPTFEEVIAIAHKLETSKAQPMAAKLIQAHGAEKLAQMDKAKYPAFVAAATVMLNEASSDL